MKIYRGKSVSTGIEIGNAVIFANTEKVSIQKVKILDEEKEPSWKRFEQAIKTVIDYYLNLKEGSKKEQSEVIDTYIMMLSDNVFISDFKKTFYDENLNIEFLLKQAVEKQSAFMRSLDDESFEERADDIKDVFGKVILYLLGIQNPNENTEVNSDSIIFAENITTATAMSLFKKNIKGLVLKEGGISSHISILARTYCIPSIIGVENPTQIVRSGEKIIIDSTKSFIISEPDRTTLSEYEKRVEEQKQKKIELNKFIKKKALTKDGTQIKIYSNISSVEEAEIAKKEGSDGIGLFRTEFLFMNNEESLKMANENEQYKIYSSVLKIMGSKPVTIRTLDCGGDKITSFNGTLSEKEENPLLGCRAIRFSLQRPDIFKTQLKALYRASVNGNLRILLPMVTNATQLVQTKKLIEEIKKELDAGNIPYKKDIPLGIMIETPVAAVMIDDLANYCDFFSIGSNDLTQYMIAVDRENSSVSSLYSEANPSILRMVAWTTWVANKLGKPISVCGEMANRKETITFLLNFGIRNLSVNPASTSKIKEILSEISIPKLKNLSKECLWNTKVSDAVGEFFKTVINQDSKND